MSKALIFAEQGENMLCTKIVLNVGNNSCTQHVLPRFKLGNFMYWTCNSMNNLSSYCGLVVAKIRASDKDLPVLSRSIYESLIIKILFSQIYTNLQCFSQGFLNNRFPQKVPRILFSICFTIIITWPISLDFFFLLADQSQNLILRIQIYIS